MKKQNGFAPLLIVVLIALSLVVAGGGYVVYKDQQQQKIDKQNVQNFLNSQANTQTETVSTSVPFDSSNKQTSVAGTGNTPVNVNDQTNWKLFENKKFQVSFKYPPNFQFEKEEDYSNIPSNINPGYWVRFIGSDKQTALVFTKSLDPAPALKAIGSNPPPPKSSQEQLTDFFNSLNNRQPQSYDKVGTPFATKVNFNGVQYIKYGIIDGDYGFITYVGAESYQFDLVKPPIYSKSTYKQTGYGMGILSDSDFDKVLESFTFSPKP